VSVQAWLPAPGTRRRWLIGAGGFAALIALWQLFTATLAAGDVEWPTPWSIVTLLHRDG
jgi:ABC-type nitrate/sulfonate/bicarbonate transport system permease component